MRGGEEETQPRQCKREEEISRGRRERTHRNLFHCLLMWWSNNAVTLWHKSHTRTSAVHTEKGTPYTWCHWRKCKIYSFRWHLLWSTFQQVGINVTSVCRWCSCNRCIWGTCPGIIWHSVVCWWKRLTAWLLYCKHYNHPYDDQREGICQNINTQIKSHITIFLIEYLNIHNLIIF